MKEEFEKFVDKYILLAELYMALGEERKALNILADVKEKLDKEFL